MKKFVLLMICTISFVVGGFAQKSAYRGEKGVTSIGLMAGYAIDYETLAVGLDVRYNLLDRMRLAPSGMYLLKKGGCNAWLANIDFHYLARITEKSTLYPIGGIGVSINKFEMSNDVYDGAYPMLPEMNEAINKTRVGLNLGFGAECRVTRDIILGAEFKYNLMPDGMYNESISYNKALLLGRIAYYF